MQLTYPPYPNAYNEGLKVCNGSLFFPANYTVAGIEPYVLTTNPLGIESNTNKTDFELYPNPCNNSMTIRSSSAEILENLIIEDITGKEMYHNTLNASSELHINTEAYSNGLYFVRLSANHSIQIKKLLIQH